MVEVGGWRERKGETKNERATVKPEHRSLKSVDNTLYIYRGEGGGREILTVHLRDKLSIAGPLQEGGENQANIILVL